MPFVIQPKSHSEPAFKMGTPRCAPEDGRGSCVVNLSVAMVAPAKLRLAQGVDNEGQWRSGVLEASWRSGGASTAELAALAAFVESRGLQVVEASAVKEFGMARDAP